mgnify:CR=1 FL=1
MGKETSSSKCEINIQISSTWNYPSYQADYFSKKENGNTRSTSFSFIKRITVANRTAISLKNCAIRFSVSPSYCSIDPIKIDFLEAGKNTEVDHFSSVTDYASLYALSTSVPGELVVDLVDDGGEIIETKKASFSFDSISHSLYASNVKELIASYITPDDEQIASLVNEAKTILKEKYDSTFGGYSYRDPNKVVEEIDSIYLSILNKKLALIMSDASPVSCLQNVRLSAQTLTKKEGNCVDFAILFATAIEAISLRPIVLFTSDSVLVGVYLDESIIGSPFLDNDTELLKLASKGFDRLILLDPTNCSKEKSANFSNALDEGYNALLMNHSFLYAIDIFASRKDHIFPVPTSKKTKDGTQIIFPDFTAQSEYSTPTIDVNARRYLDSDAPSKKNKFDYWEEKLLDLSMNNRLINMRFPNSFPQVLNLNSESLFSMLGKTNKISLAFGDDISTSSEERNAPSLFPSLEKNRFKDFLSKKVLYLSAKEGNTDDYLKNLARKANTAIEESGCNPLFLTVGLIKWFDNEKAALVGKGALYSPLFLLPVKMPRRRIGSFYSLEYNFDDLGLNTTIFEYFRENFDLDFAPIFGELNKQANGEVDVRLVFNYIREKIAPFKGWALMEEPCAISLFSFARFVMWNDIKTHRSQMMQNELISSFVNGCSSNKPVESPKKETLDEEISSSSLAIPLPADSSQIEAINASTKGQSFVLDGPPGTGKSQTIANMITNALYHGKTVLFVAEKGVALEVVKKRLDTLGIGQFCLSIPSINTAKGDVLSSLGKMLDLGPVAKPDDFEKESSLLDETRDHLNRDLYVLHKKGNYVFSPYDAIIHYLRLSSFQSLYPTSHKYAASLSTQNFELAQKELTNLSIQGASVGGYFGNPFLPFTGREYSIETRDKFFEKIPSLISDLKEFHLTIYNCFFKDEGLMETRANVERYAKILKILQNNSSLFQDFLGDDSFVEKKEDLQEYLLLVGRKNKIKEQLLESWEEGFLSQNGDALLAKQRALKRAGFFERRRLFASLRKTLKPFAKEKASLKKRCLEDSLSLLIDYHHLEEDITRCDSFAKYVFSKFTLSSSKDVEAAIDTYERTLSIIDVKRGMQPAKQFSSENIDNAIRHLATDSTYLFAKSRMSFLAQYEALENKLGQLKKEFQFDLCQYQDSVDFYLHAASSLTDAYSSKGKLSEWTNFLRTLDRVSELVPEDLILRFKRGEIREEGLFPSYICSLSYRIFSDSLSENDLTTLNAKDTEEQIARYKNAIDDFCKTSVIETVSRITSLYPSTQNTAPSTETYQLRKLVKNGGRGVSLRQIFDHYGTLIRTLCPCFLMSPASVAQYLDINSYSFDLVIFDEASQIPTSEAIGAIARAKTVIIAGDQEQMPPTNFFMANGGHSYDGTIQSSVTEDLESLLDDSIALGLPRKRLTWHYRSRHEALIAFSNHKFYDNNLLTFPSPIDEKSSVSSVFVGGKYEIKRGVNRKEAEAVVDEILRRLKDPTLSRLSLGVVTFNEAQQNLIEDLLERKLSLHEERKPGGEDIFVKNLENVQGDERDVILFSTTYAPKENGKLSLNFGPLSREKGERRLNVAITRAREEMIVFTSMKPIDIEAEKAKNAGASYLRSFLLFAEMGVSVLPNNIASHVSASSISIADFLAKDLKRLGYETKINVGSSSFKVDLAIVDPKDKNHFLLGILVDGDSYCHSPTCRDRNVVEPGILKTLGWNLYRVWSVEYLDHPSEVVKGIVSAINSSSNVSDGKEKQNSPFDEPLLFKKKEVTPHPYAIPYLKGEYTPQIPDDFSNKATASRLVSNYIADVLHNESPISEKLLNERIRQAYGLTRIGSNIRDVINMALVLLAPDKEMKGGAVFYWDKDKKKEEFRYYRLNDENTKRDISDISFIELGNAIADILIDQGKMTAVDLFKQVNFLFGFTTLKEKARKHLETSLKANVNQRLGIVEEDGYVMIKNKS